MSMPRSKSIICPECNKKNKIIVWHSVNVDSNAEAKEQVKSGKLFEFNCKECGKALNLEYDFLYHDVTNEFMIWYFPEKKHNLKQEEEKTNEEVDVKLYKNSRIVGNKKSLIEKIKIFEDKLDDVAIEIIKYFISEHELEKDVEVIYTGKEKDKLLFSLSNGVSASFPIESYEQISRDYLIPDTKDFIIVDRNILKTVAPHLLRTKVSIRKVLQLKYYTLWKPLRSAWDYQTETGYIKMYNEYIDKLKEFIQDCDAIIERNPDLKTTFNPNSRQTGGYKRCMAKEVEGWSTKHEKFAQRYKELMVDYLCYDDEIKYEEISMPELKDLKEMAKFIINEAEKNICELKMKDDPKCYINKVVLRGYITKKPNTRKTSTGIQTSSFVLAVMRNYKTANNSYDFDYINCICWRDLAKQVALLEKDDFVEVEGSIQTRIAVGSDNEKKYITEVYCLRVEKI